MAPEAVVFSSCEAPDSACEDKQQQDTVAAKTADEDDDSVMSCCEMSCESDKDPDDTKPSRIVDLFDSATDCMYSLFFCGYRSLFLDTYLFEDFIFYTLWMLCLHFCINEKMPNDSRHYM
ncbi:uncharacterized protein [Dermacentor albipictus]|uniref:uncharacterized protein n=1 Tax=Dermacentor albipictus TaxID=60249 RepID=UPI0031FBF04D